MAAAGGAAGELVGSSALTGVQVLDLLADRARPRRAAAAAAKYGLDEQVAGSPWLQLCSWAVGRMYPAADEAEQRVLLSALSSSSSSCCLVLCVMLLLMAHLPST
jgi:hypothetical protein